MAADLQIDHLQPVPCSEAVFPISAQWDNFFISMKDNTNLVTRIFLQQTSTADLASEFGAERIATMRVLGIVIKSRLTTKDHLDHLLSSSCASSIPGSDLPWGEGVEPPSFFF